MPHFWPIFDLVVRTPRLELRLPHDEDVLRLMDVAADGIHDPETMPFSRPWSRAKPPELHRNALRFHWSARAGTCPESWQLPLAVYVDGKPVGCQDAGATDFAVRRAVGTGSWLGRPWQGSGLGTEMRAAILHLVFAGLGARYAFSGYVEGNEVSRRVSEKLGYEPNGFRLHTMDDKPLREQQLVLTRERWERSRRDDIEISGLDACRELLGAQLQADSDS